MAIGLFLTVAAAVATLCFMLAPRFWVVDLMVHFRLQFAALALLGCVILAAAGSAGWAALAFVSAALQALSAAPLLASRAAPAQAARAPAFRVAAINVYYKNRQFRRVIDLIAHERPDIVVLCEVTAEWQQALAVLDEEYPQRFVTRGTRGTGIVVMSRWPMQAAVLPDYSDVEPAVAASVQINDRSVRILGVHTSWPLGPHASALRDRQLAMIGDFARVQAGPLIVLGDLNVSPFSRYFQAMLAGGGLKSAAQGFGWQPTWPTFLPPGGIQIDHALTGAGVAVVNFRRGASVGSDHLPIVIDCAW